MLKIKDSVDLRELEKFGLKYDENCGKYKFIERNFNGATYIYINVWNGKIIYRQERENDGMCLNLLYDLIKADLVEKVNT